MISPTLITTPRIFDAIVSFDSIRFVGWDVARPERVVDCCGFNERQAIDDAAIKLGAPGWRIRVRPALPEPALQSTRVA